MSDICQYSAVWFLVVRIETFDKKDESNVPRDRVAFKSSAPQAIATVMSRASFCCSNKARKLHLFSAKVAFMRCKLHLCAHLTVKDLKQLILHAKIEKVAKSCMQKSKKLQKVAI